MHCGAGQWRQKIAARAGLAEHETAVRATIRRPDRVYDDPQAMAEVRRLGNPQARVQHCVGVGRTHGTFAGNYVVVVIKWLPEGPAGELVGYVRTAWLGDRLRLGKLELVQERR